LPLYADKSGLVLTSPAGAAKCFRRPAALPAPAFSGIAGQVEAYAGEVYVIDETGNTKDL